MFRLFRDFRVHKTRNSVAQCLCVYWTNVLRLFYLFPNECEFGVVFGLETIGLSIRYSVGVYAHETAVGDSICIVVRDTQSERSALCGSFFMRRQMFGCHTKVAVHE